MTQIMVKMKRKSKTTMDLNVIKKQIFNQETQINRSVKMIRK